MSVALANYNAAKRALSLAVDIDEVKNIRDKAVALRTYAMQAKDRELIDQAIEIRLRAERRAGELLRDMADRGERDVGKGGDRKSQSHAATVKLNDLNINKSQSSRWQKLAGVSTDDFEELVANAQQKAGAAVDRAQQPKPEPKPKRKPKAKPEPEPKPKPRRGGNGVGIAAASLATIAEILRGTFGAISVKERSTFLDDLRKVIRSIVAEEEALDDTDHWEEATV